MCPETDEWSSLLNQSSDNDLSLLSVRESLSGLRIYYLYINIIIPIVHSILGITAYSNTRSIDLCKSIYIIQLYSKLLFYILSLLLTPAF